MRERACPISVLGMDTPPSENVLEFVEKFKTEVGVSLFLLQHESSQTKPIFVIMFV